MLRTTAPAPRRALGARVLLSATRRLGAGAALLLLAACGGGENAAGPQPNPGNGNNGNGNNPPPPAAVASISVTPGNVSLVQGATQGLTVVVRDAGGNELTGRALAFSSSAVAVATVSATGVVTGVTPGDATITVTSEGKSATSAVSVVAPPPAAVASVQLTPANLALDAGETAQLTARVADAANNTLTGRTVTWTSATPAIATVDANGRVTAVAAGMARITATSEGKSAEAAVLVRRVVASVEVSGALDTLEAYDVRSLRAVARDAQGAIIDDVQFTWTSSNVNVATVQSPQGVLDGAITGVDRGTVVVTATSPNGKSGSATRVVVIKYRSITTATQHSCDIASGGIAWCWGLNSTDARLGNADVGDGKHIATPWRVPGERGWTQLVSFARFTCGIKTDGKAYCWGNNSWGVLGDGSNKAYSATPVPIAGNHTFVQLAAGVDHACGLTTTNALLCWGKNEYGQFGNGTTGPSVHTPVAAAGGMQFKAVMASTAATCAVTVAGQAYCWGNNGTGETGNGQRIPYGNALVNAPVAVVGGHTFKDITGGQSYACGLTTNGSAYCWGANGGRFGNGNTTDNSTPQPVSGGYTFSAINSGYGHSCGITTANDIVCWGGNTNGQIGTTSQNLRVPYLLPGIKGAEAAAAGIGTGSGAHSCAISKDRLTVWCWGRNDFGQLGNGATTPDAVMNPVGIVVGQKPL